MMLEIICKRQIHDSIFFALLLSYKMRLTYSLSTKRRNFSLSRKVDRWKLFSLQPSSAINKTLSTLMREQRSQQWEKVVTTWVHLFGLTNKATWPKLLTSGAKINCQACLWTRSLPVSVVPCEPFVCLLPVRHFGSLAEQFWTTWMTTRAKAYWWARLYDHYAFYLTTKRSRM